MKTLLSVVMVWVVKLLILAMTGLGHRLVPMVKGLKEARVTPAHPERARTRVRMVKTVITAMATAATETVAVTAMAVGMIEDPVLAG